ncbi:hypothetical protein UNH65_24665 [Chitinophaga sp. 180180018-2]|nr:hypothetical protein [Chitinophaga sp. 212800010-3]
MFFYCCQNYPPEHSGKQEIAIHLILQDGYRYFIYQKVSFGLNPYSCTTGSIKE